MNEYLDKTYNNRMLLDEAGYKPPMQALMSEPNPVDVEMQRQLNKYRQERRTQEINN